MAKGTGIAYQALKPAELKVGDIVSGWVDNYIKEGNAQRAAELKRLQERNASIDEFYKSFKIEAKETDKYITDANYKLTSELTNKIGQYKLDAKNAQTDVERNALNMKAQKLYDQYKFYQTSLGGSQFLDGIKKVRDFAATGDAFDDSEQVRLMKAYEGNLWRMGTDDDGQIRIYAKTGQNINDPEKEYSLTELMALATGQAQVDMLEDTKSRGKGLYSEMQSRAKLLTEEYTNNPTGDRLKSAKEFVKERAGVDFDSKYGGFNANRGTNSMEDLPSLEYGQFAIKSIGKIPTSEAEHNELRNKYIEKMSIYAPTKTKDVNEVSDYGRMKDEREWQLKLAKFQAQQMGAIAKAIGRQSKGSGGLDEALIPASTMLRLPTGKNSEGKNVVGYYQQQGISIKGSAKTGATSYDPITGEKISGAKDVFVTAYWNPKGGKTGKGGVAYGITLPTANEGMTTKPLGTKLDPTGVSKAQKYLTNTDYPKLLKAASILQKNSELQNAGEFVKNLPLEYRNVDFTGY